MRAEPRTEGGDGSPVAAARDGGSWDPLARSYLDHLTVERGVSANTLDAYRRDLRRYAEYLAARGTPEAAAATESDVADFVTALRTGDQAHPPLSAASAARTLVAVRGLHRFAAREGLVDHDPAREVRPPRRPQRLPKALPVTDVLRILAAVGDDGPLPLRDRALLEFLYGTGARVTEAVGLAVDDLDREAASVRLHGKGDRYRVVPVGSYALTALDAYLVRGRPSLAARGRGNAALFLNARGGPLSRQSAWKILRVTAERAGLAAETVRTLSPHTLRHSYATHLLEGGADVRVVQELLGHASVTTTQLYTKVTIDSLREVYASTHPRARP